YASRAGSGPVLCVRGVLVGPARSPGVAQRLRIQFPLAGGIPGLALLQGEHVRERPARLRGVACPLGAGLLSVGKLVQLPGGLLALLVQPADGLGEFVDLAGRLAEVRDDIDDDLDFMLESV